MAKPALVPGQTPHAHVNADGDGHHGHLHHSHDTEEHHGHAHHDGSAGTGQFAAVPAMALERADPPRLSLMALSSAQRLALAMPFIACLWLLTLWALRNG